MVKLLLALQSKTVWTVVLMVALNVIPGLPIGQATKDLATGILGLLAAYWKVNPSTDYSLK